MKCIFMESEKVSSYRTFPSTLSDTVHKRLKLNPIFSLSLYRLVNKLRKHERAQNVKHASICLYFALRTVQLYNQNLTKKKQTCKKKLNSLKNKHQLLRTVTVVDSLLQTKTKESACF